MSGLAHLLSNKEIKMKPKNKVAAIFATLLVTIFLLAGCSAPTQTTNNEAAALAETQSDTAVITNPVTTNPVTDNPVAQSGI
jgi:uncharacterized lipoprotein YajG